MTVVLPTLRRPRIPLPRCVPVRLIVFDFSLVHGFIRRLSLTIYHVQIVQNFGNKSDSGDNTPDPKDGDVELVREAKKNVPEPQDYSYSERDVILYNLSIGTTEQELHWTFENHEEFAALPTFGVVPQF